PVGPGVRDDLALALEVVLDVALAAHERAHLLPRRIAIGIIVRDALMGLERLDAGDEPGARHAGRHRFRIVAIEAGDGMLDEKLPLVVLEIPGLAVRHPGNLLESLLHIPLADEAIERQRRGVTLQTRAGLLALGDPLRLLLVEEAVVVAAAVAIVEREGIAGEDALEPRLL